MTGERRILVVDDEPIVRASCRRTLEEEGHAVTLVARGEDAFPALRDERFDAVLLDLKMPGMGGIEVLARIRELWPGLPVVIMTGYATRDQQEAAAEQGATTWLPKPFGPPELLDALARALS